ncbi:MAG: efflux RND transporter periplasmic adaptor subunit [Bacteroidota bacterium]|nr:efflux RND transporter periplasmic adaptor subunit [Bacteroidota bacterium]
MKFSLLIISIPVLFWFNSCHRGAGEGDNSASGEENYQTDEAGEIVITREQFESMDMEIGDPASMMFSNSVSANGYIDASPTGSAKISTLISGRVRQIYYSSGDYVKSRQTLFSLESHEIILLQQTYAESFQRLKLLKADYERLQLLWNEKIGAEKDFLKAESEYRSVQAEVEGLKARLNMMHIDPSVIENGHIVPYLDVKTPISGTITRQELVLGQHLIPLEPGMEVVNGNMLRLRLELFEKSIADLLVGQEVTFSIPDQPEKEFSATLSHIGKSVSSDTRTLECFAELSKEDKKLFVNNMYVEATIVTCEREARAIPEEALIREPERDFVLILIREEEGEMTFRKVPVQTGVTRLGYTEVLDNSLSSILLVGTYNLWTEE